MRSIEIAAKGLREDSGARTPVKAVRMEYGRNAADKQNAPPRGAAGRRTYRWSGAAAYLRCFETSFVISNMLTWRLPPNTARSLSSALIIVRLVLS